MLRRAEDPTLRWRAAGADQQYRVAVRNEDTGHKAIIYEGFRLDCRLPADLRLTSDQLAYRVETRSGSDLSAPFVRCQSFTAIPRIGDKLNPTWKDRLSIPAVPGCSEYRLQVRDSTNKKLVDMIGPNSWFLLPAGQLMDQATEWSIRPRSGEHWAGAEWKRVRQVELDDAITRAHTPVPVKVPKRPKITAAPWRPGRPASLKALPPHPAGVAIVAAVTAEPKLGPAPSAKSVVEAQWIGAPGGGATERASLYLASQNCSGWFFLDIDAAMALDFETMGRLAERLRADGHRIGLYIGTDWAVVRGDAPASHSDRLATLLNALAPLSGEPVAAVMIGPGPARAEWLQACRTNGVAAVVTTRGALQGGPQWMHWRTEPFLAMDDLVVLPTAMSLSTPAHPRDQVVRHPYSNRDAMAAGASATTLKSLCGVDNMPGGLTLIEIDPLRLLTRRWKRSRPEAVAWNQIIEAEQPGWVRAGWKRAATGFESGEGVGEIQLDILGTLLRGVAASGVTPASFMDVFSADKAAGWLRPERAFTPVLEQKRGVRRCRPTAIRQYDEAFRIALKAAHK